MPAEQITKVMPIASTPITEVDRTMLRELETERKTGDSIAMTATSAASTSSDSKRNAAAPTRRARQDARRAAGEATADIGGSRDSVGEAPPVATGRRRPTGGAASSAYLTYCSSGSVLASSVALVSTRVGT